EQLSRRGLANDTVIDWLLWWDNALLWALRPQLPHGRLLAVVRDPRDMLLDWIAYGAAVPLAVTSLAEAAEWLARVMAQLATLQEQDLYPLRLLRIDEVGNDPRAMAALLQEAFGARIPPAQAIGAPRLPAGHWRNYREVMADAFELLTPVAVRLGYQEEVRALAGFPWTAGQRPGATRPPIRPPCPAHRHARRHRLAGWRR